jgi:hypothetical protein
MSDKGSEYADFISKHIGFYGLARPACHAIPPIVLAKIVWAHWEMIGNPLKKRLRSAPAGCAYVGAFVTGFDDVFTFLPQWRDKYDEGYDLAQEFLESIEVGMDKPRIERIYRGSINHNLYNLKRVELDPKQLAIAASVIKACYEHLKEESKMNNCLSLARVARQAEITGEIF